MYRSKVSKVVNQAVYYRVRLEVRPGDIYTGFFDNYPQYMYDTAIKARLTTSCYIGSLRADMRVDGLY